MRGLEARRYWGWFRGLGLSGGSLMRVILFVFGIGVFDLEFRYFARLV